MAFETYNPNNSYNSITLITTIIVRDSAAKAQAAVFFCPQGEYNRL